MNNITDGHKGPLSDEMNNINEGGNEERGRASPPTPSNEIFTKNEP